MVRIKPEGDAWIDEPLADHVARLGVYERTVKALDGEHVKIKVYNGDSGELRIRIGRWKEGNG